MGYENLEPVWKLMNRLQKRSELWCMIAEVISSMFLKIYFWAMIQKRGKNFFWNFLKFFIERIRFVKTKLKILIFGFPPYEIISYPFFLRIFYCCQAGFILYQNFLSKGWLICLYICYTINPNNNVYKSCHVRINVCIHMHFKY